MDILDVYVGIGHRLGKDPVHWLLITVAPDSDKCTWYHVTSSSAYEIRYERKIQSGKRFNSFSIASKERIGIIRVADRGKLLQAVHQVPAQMCQRWVVGVLEVMERRGLVAQGTAGKWGDRVEDEAAQNWFRAGDGELIALNGSKTSKR